MRPEEHCPGLGKPQRSQVSLNAILSAFKHNSPPNVSVATYATDQRHLHSDAVYRTYVMNTKLSMVGEEGCCVDDGQYEVRIDNDWSVFAFVRKLSTHLLE